MEIWEVQEIKGVIVELWDQPGIIGRKGIMGVKWNCGRQGIMGTVQCHGGEVELWETQGLWER